MAALTWRNVDAPNFAPAIQGYQQFSQLLGNAFNGANTALDTFDVSKTNKVSNAFIQDLLTKYTETPDKLNADLQSGAIFEGVDRNRLNNDVMNLLARRSTDLLAYEQGKVNLEDTRADSAFQRTEEGWKTSDRSSIEASKPIAAQLMSIYGGAGTDAEKAAARNALLSSEAGQAALRGLTSTQQAALVTDPMKILQTDLEVASGRNNLRQQDDQHNAAVFDLQRGQWTFNNEQVDRTEQRIGVAAGEKLLETAGDPDSALAALNSPEFLKLPPAARAIARQTIMNTFGNVFAPEGGGDASGSATAAGGADPTRVMNYEARAAGFASVPASVRTLGQASEFARQVNRAGASSSAMGTYQIVGQTLRGYGPKVFGSNWQNIEFNQANQDKLARQIFMDHRGSAAALRKQWVSLSPAEAERIRKLPWEQAREVIARGESGASPAAIALESQARVSQLSTVGDPQGLNDRFENVSNAPEAAAALRAAGAFKGTSEGWLNDQIRSIVERSAVNGRPTLNYAQAARIMHNNMRHSGAEDTSFLGSIFNTNPNVNSRGIVQAISDARNGRNVDDGVKIEDVRAAAAQVETARASRDAAASALAAARRRGALQPGYLKANEPRLRARLDAAEAAFQQATRAAMPIVEANRVRETPGSSATVAGTVSDFLSSMFKLRRD